MKSGRAKSFRLHHINKTSELRKTSRSFIEPDECFKLAALNSVTRGVKMADLSMMTGNDLNKLRMEPLQSRNGEEGSAHCNLMGVRLRYDEMKKNSCLSEARILKQKEQINKLQIFKTELEYNQNESKTVAGDLEAKLAAIKTSLDQSSTEYKVIQNMKVRHHADKVVYDQRKFDSEQLLRHKKAQFEIFKREEISETEGQDRTLKLSDKLQDELAQEQFEREEHIHNLENMIEEKLMLINVNSTREGELAEIASRAIQDKMQTEKHWRMVYLTNSFVNKTLRNKIESEMNKFKIVEQAFKTIKTATGVSNSKTLVQKYLNKEIVYGQHLGKIADNERIISDLKAEGDKLIHETKLLEAEKEVLENTKIKHLDLHENVKQFGIEDAKAMKAYSLTKRLNQWLRRQFKKLLVVTGSTEKQPEEFGEAIRQFLTRVSVLFDSVEEQAEYQKAGDLGRTEKNVRVLPKRSRKNSMGEQIYDVDQQEVNTGISHEQSDFLNAQHDDLIHTNDRFMRELRKKFEEERKIQLDKHTKKDKSPSKVAQPKVEED